MEKICLHFQQVQTLNSKLGKHFEDQALVISEKPKDKKILEKTKRTKTDFCKGNLALEVTFVYDCLFVPLAA